MIDIPMPFKAFLSFLNQDKTRPLILSSLLSAGGVWFLTSPNSYLRQIGMLYFGMSAGVLLWAWPPFQKRVQALIALCSFGPDGYEELTGSDVSEQETFSRWHARLAFTVSGAVIVLFLGTFLRYRVSIPFADDYVSFVSFVAKFPTLSWHEIFDRIFLNHYMEHIIATSYLLMIVSSLGTGQINPLGLTFMGFLSLFLYLALFRANLPKLLHLPRPLVLLPVICLLFQMQYYLVVAWPTNFPCVLLFHVLVLGSFHFISRRQIGAAATCAVLATLTFGSGFLTLLLVFLILVLRNDFKAAVLWYFPMTIGLGIFFRTFRDPSAYPFHLDEFLKFSVAFLGSVATFGIFGGPDISVTWFGKAAALGTGLIFLLLFIWLTLRRAYLRNTPVYTLLCFLILSALMAAKQRGYLGIQQVFQSRYHLYSALIAICLYVLSLQSFGQVRRKWIWGIALLAISVNLLSWRVGEENLRRHVQNLAFGYYLTQVRPVSSDPGLRVPSPEDVYLYAVREIPDQGSVHIPVEEFYRVMGSSEVAPNFLPSTDSSRLTKNEITRPKIVRSSLFTEISFEGPAQETYYVSFSNDDKTSVFEAIPLNRRAVSWSLMRNFFSSASTVLAMIPRAELAPGKYGLKVYSKTQGQWAYEDFGVVGLE
jgi:hypothetical protein